MPNATLARARALLEAHEPNTAFSDADLDIVRAALSLGVVAEETCERMALTVHDARVHLNVIAASAELLLKFEVDPAKRVRLERAARAATRVTTLLEDAMDAAGLGSGSFRIVAMDVDLAELVTRAIQLLETVALEKPVVLVSEMSGLRSVCDGTRILRVIENLLMNAIKFSPPGGRVSISSTSVSGDAAVSVRDEGPGILDEDLTRVFDRHWFRGQQSGDGLGLYIARKIIEAHGGRIWAENALKGCVFTFTLPNNGQDQRSP